MLGRIESDDRDALQNKRIETPGVLIGQLFRQNWKKMLNEIGKTFRSKGKKAAIDLGYKLVSGEKKTNRIDSWIKFILKNNNCFIFCYRGGLRSQIAYEWIRSRGVSINRLEHGYKKYRQQVLLMHQNIRNYTERWVILGGYTGSGKTDIIKNYPEAYVLLKL